MNIYHIYIYIYLAKKTKNTYLATWENKISLEKLNTTDPQWTKERHLNPTLFSGWNSFKIGWGSNFLGRFGIWQFKILCVSFRWLDTPIIHWRSVSQDPLGSKLVFFNTRWQGEVRTVQHILHTKCRSKFHWGSWCPNLNCQLDSSTWNLHKNYQTYVYNTFKLSDGLGRDFSRHCIPEHEHFMTISWRIVFHLGVIGDCDMYNFQKTCGDFGVGTSGKKHEQTKQHFFSRNNWV